jgi:hypothetical protein
MRTLTLALWSSTIVGVQLGTICALYWLRLASAATFLVGSDVTVFVLPTVVACAALMFIFGPRAPGGLPSPLRMITAVGISAFGLLLAFFVALNVWGS